MPPEDHTLPPADSISHGHEPLAVSVRGVVIATIGLLLLMIVPMLALWAFYYGYFQPNTRTAETEPPWADDAPLPMEPNLFADQPQELRDLRSAEDERLTTTGWVNQDERIAHIPIDEAMTMIASDGLPQWSPPAEESAVEESDE